MPGRVEVENRFFFGGKAGQTTEQQASGQDQAGEFEKLL